MARTLVAGGTGGVGTGIVRALLERDGTVVVPSRSQDSLDDLRARLDDPGDALVGVVGDLGDRAGAAAVAERAGALDHAVVSVGGWWSGPPARELDPDELDRVLAMGLHAHLFAAQALLPSLDGVAGATYLMINGGGALAPVAGSSAVVVSAAAQLMLARALEVEQPDEGATVRSVLLMTPIVTHTRPEGRDGWLTADEVGDRVVALQADPGDDVAVEVHGG